MGEVVRVGPAGLPYEAEIGTRLLPASEGIPLRGSPPKPLQGWASFLKSSFGWPDFEGVGPRPVPLDSDRGWNQD